jgi:hypothetical protein
MQRPYPFPADAGLEPPLAELLADPTLHLLLARDGLGIDDVKREILRWHLARHARAAIRVDAAA